MAIYTSRFSNPALRRASYATVRIALGTPKWDLGYRLDGELNDLMPFGLLNKFEDYDSFKRAYFQRLDRVGVEKILRELQRFESSGLPTVLLCYEDVRKGDDNWCHRTAFAEWWLKRTGEVIEELPDPTTVAAPKAPKPQKQAPKPVQEEENTEPPCEQLRFP